MERMDLIILKDHLDPDDKLSDEEWTEFVEECSDRLFDCCLVEGQDLLKDWSITNLNN